MVEIKKFIGQNKGKLAGGVAAATLVAIFGSSLLRAYQNRNTDEPQPTQPQTVLPTSTGVPQIETQAVINAQATNVYISTAVPQDVLENGEYCVITAKTGERFYYHPGSLSTMQGNVCLRRENGVNYWLSPHGHPFITLDR